MKRSNLATRNPFAWGRSTALAIALSCLTPGASRAQFIDFETLPGGAPTIDQQTISNEYASLGVTFSLIDSTGATAGFPLIAKTGPPQTAYQGCFGQDTPLDYLDIGPSCLTSGPGVVAKSVRIEYASPVAQASGVVLDVDCRGANGTAPCEQWTVTAFDVADSALQVVVIDAPIGPGTPGCINSTGPGDGNAFGWAFDVASPLIHSIVFQYTGAATSVGLGFDSFTASGAQPALGVSIISEADSICAGESLSLSAFPTGGAPPYAFAWEEEVTPGSWSNLGAASVQSVSPKPTANRYRVTVTDAESSQVMEVTQVPLSYGVLCSSALVVSSFQGDSVERYSLQSLLPSGLVSSGSGGLDGAAEMVFGPDGNLYASSFWTHAILRYDGTTGAFLDVFVAAGAGGLNLPVGLNFVADGDLLVSSFGSDAVLRYDGTTGAFVSVFASGPTIDGPVDLLVGPGNEVYVGNQDLQNVVGFDGATGSSLGTFVSSGSGGLDGPRGMEFGPDGHLYVASRFNHSVLKYDGATGASLGAFVASGSGGLNEANDIAFPPDGFLYVVSVITNQVLRYDGTTGAFVDALPTGVLNAPAYLAIGQPPAPTSVPTLPAMNSHIALGRPAPNPFADVTTLQFMLPSAAHARVYVVDVTGRRVAALRDTWLEAGRHVTTWSGRNTSGQRAAPGIYFVHLDAGGQRSTRKLALLR